MYGTRYKCQDCGNEHSFEMTIEQQELWYYHVDQNNNCKWSEEEIDKGNSQSTIKKISCHSCHSSNVLRIDIYPVDI